MLKFTLLFSFIFVCIHWLYRPVNYHPSEEMINQYRPSVQMKTQEITIDTPKVAESLEKTSAMPFLIAYE